ncbi:MAG: pilin [Patescibacteria group bacterium]
MSKGYNGMAFSPEANSARAINPVLVVVVVIIFATLAVPSATNAHNLTPSGSLENSCHCEENPGHTTGSHTPFSSSDAGISFTPNREPTLAECCAVCSNSYAPHWVQLTIAHSQTTCPAAPPAGTTAPPPGAAPPPLPTAYPLINPLGAATIQALIGNLIKGALGIVGSVALVIFIYGGFLWLTSGGNPEKITKGKSTMVWGTIGLAVILFAYTLVQFVFQALGI